MGHYDLYGNSYPTRLAAENAEMAQCAAIDADIAMREVEQMKRDIYTNQQPTQLEYDFNLLQQHVTLLEERIAKLETLLTK